MHQLVDRIRQQPRHRIKRSPWHRQLLPELCVTCLAHPAQAGLCAGCRSDLPRNDCGCRVCGLPLNQAEATTDLICGDCLRAPPAFDSATIPWRYQFPVDRMISRYKYRKQRSFARPLLTDMARHVQQQMDQHPQQRPDLMVAAPMHPKRQRRRGFNQAADIAEAISLATALPWTDTLAYRIRPTASQSGLDRQQRLRNLKQVFRVSGKVPPHVAIVDDVVTTGATVAALAGELRRHGAQYIQVWALARTPAQPIGSGQSFSNMTGNRQAGRQAGGLDPEQVDQPG